MPAADDFLPPSNQTLRAAFESLIDALDECEARYAVIGGLAVIQHGRVRTTEDIDLLLGIPQISLPAFFDALSRRGFVFDLPQCIREFVDDGCTTIRFGDVLVDLLRPILPAWLHVLERRVTITLFGRDVCIGSIEGLIVMKLMSDRPQDEADVRELLSAHAGKLDLDFIRAELATFSEPGDPRRARFEAWVKQAAADSA